MAGHQKFSVFRIADLVVGCQQPDGGKGGVCSSIIDCIPEKIKTHREGAP